jgi:hypothetical protein
VGSIPPAGTIDLKGLNAILDPFTYPPRIRLRILTSKIVQKIKLKFEQIFVSMLSDSPRKEDGQFA